MTAFLQSLFPFGFLKLMILSGVIIYVVFAFVIVVQERLMSHVVNTPLSIVLRAIAVIHFLAALVVLGLSLILL